MSYMDKEKKPSSFVAIIPIIIFVCVFLSAGIYCAKMGMDRPFAQFPASMGAYVALISAFLILKGSLSDKFNWMLKSIARPNIIIPVLVLALAGGFSTIAKACGGVDSIVGLCLEHVPTSVIMAGFFIVGSIISLASGSSASAIVAIAPIALTVADSAGISLPLTIGVIMSSAMFGNSCSPISDCTIVSNSIMGLGAKKGPTDKLMSQLMLYAVPYILAFILFAIFGRPHGEVVVDTSAYVVNIWSILPYVLILVLAFVGINFVVSLSAGIFMGLLVGILQGTFNLLDGFKTLADGMFGMANMMLLFIFMAGVVGIVSEAGGIEWVISKLTKLIRGRKSAEAVIMFMCGFVVFFVGNDTIPMMTLGDVIKDISRRYRIDPRRTAMIMPIATAGMATIVPYTAVTLIMASYIDNGGYNASFAQGIPYNWFVLLTFVFAVISIIIPFTNRRFEKDPWDYEKWCMQSEAEESIPSAQ